MHKPTLDTLKNKLSITPATSAELDIVLDMLEEAARWITSKGIDQWQPGSFADQRKQKIAGQVDHGEVYLARVDGKPFGTFTLQWADPLVWQNVPDDAGYMHRLAVRRAFAGQGLGQALLASAGSKVVAAGKRYLRLDCMAENEALRLYYERAGFSYCGDLSGNGWSASLYEKLLRTRNEDET